MSEFSPDWLGLREPFDLAARDRGCAARFVAALGERHGAPLRLLDLAAGSGASFRALAPIIGIDQAWSLVDHDVHTLGMQAEETARWAVAAGWCARSATPSFSPKVPQQAGRGGARSCNAGDCARDPGAHQSVADIHRIEVRAGSARWTAHGQQIDLERNLDALDFTQFDGITTSAFLDLVSQEWLERFASKLIASRRPLLATLTVNGVRDWDPDLTGDIAVRAAFARHQTRDKGFGPALGPVAVRQLARLLETSAYQVTIGCSDWHIVPDAHAMLRRLLEDTLHAAVQVQPRSAAAFEAWGRTRRDQLEAGRLSLRVGHLDLFALPATSV